MKQKGLRRETTTESIYDSIRIIPGGLLHSKINLKTGKETKRKKIKSILKNWK